MATQRGIPIVFLGESSGARMPDTWARAAWARCSATIRRSISACAKRRGRPPTLGDCYGSSSWYAVLLGLQRDAQGRGDGGVEPAARVELAISEDVDPEELGGWRLHAETTGFADCVVDTDEEALDAIRKFLSYMPSHHNEAPPRAAGAGGLGRGMADMLDVAAGEPHPGLRRAQDHRAPSSTRQLLRAQAAVRQGRGHRAGAPRRPTVGIIANNPLFKGGALDTDACDKITGFLVLCDSFNIPLVMLVDTPGFVIGTEAERKRAPGKIMNFMNALPLCTVPKLSVILRKSYGQAYLNMGGGRNSDEVAAWPTAEMSFMDPQFAVRIVHGHGAGQPEFADALRRWSATVRSGTSPRSSPCSR